MFKMNPIFPENPAQGWKEFDENYTEHYFGYTNPCKDGDVLWFLRFIFSK